MTTTTTTPTSSSSSPHTGRGLRSSFVQSLVSLEDAALDVGHQEHIRAIGARLGGSIRLSASIDEPLPTTTTTSATEQTSLLSKEDDDKAVQHKSPPLMLWIAPALLCASMYAFYNIFIKKGSYTIHPILGGVVLQFVAALLGLALLAALMAHGSAKIEYDSKGLFWSVCAGLAVGTAEMLSFVVSGMGVPATQSIPILIGGSVMFGAVLGLLLLGEVLLLHGWFGVALLVSGIAMVATDPGEKVQEGGAGTDSEEEEAPPLYLWIGPALICAAAYAFYNIFIKKGSASINPILGGVVLQFVAAVFGTVLLLLLSWKEGGFDFLFWDKMGLVWACCAGLAVGTAELLSFVVSGMGVNATQSIPIIIGGSVMFGAILGLIMLGETLELQGWFGVAALMIGIGFVATDPGEKAPGH